MYTISESGGINKILPYRQQQYIEQLARLTNPVESEDVNIMFRLFMKQRKGIFISLPN